MTDPRTGAAGWRTAAAVAPAAAATLALTTGWALAHPPESSATPATPPAPQAAPALDPALDRADLRLQREASAAQGRVEHLTRTLHRLRTRTAALRDGSLPASAAPAPPGPGAAVPAPPVAPAPAPAPATDTSTGAS